VRKIIFFLLLLSISSFAQLGLTGYNLPVGFKGVYSTFGNIIDTDPQGNTWVAFQNSATPYHYAGIGKFDGNSWTIYDSLNTPMQSNKITCLSHDHQNYLWVGTDKGLAKFDGNAWTWYDSTNSILNGNNILNVYAYYSHALIITAPLSLPIANRKIYSIDAPTGVFQLIDISVTAGNSFASYILPCISPQGNFYLKRINGSPSLVKIDTSGNQSLISLAAPSYLNKFFEVDNNEKIWWESNWYYDSAVNYFASCPTVPEAFFHRSSFAQFSFPERIKRSYQNVLYFQLDNILLSSASNSNYYIPEDSITVWPAGFSIAPSGDIWLLNDSTWEHPAVRKLYRLTPSQYNPLALVPWRRDNFLDINEVETRITPICDMHWDPITSSGPQYAVPKCSGVNSSFASAMWIGGLDGNDTLHLAAQTYRQNGLDFWPGPLDTLSASIDSATSVAYDRVWKIDRADIVNFIYQYQQGNVTNMSYPVPYNILTWPAHGTGNFSRNLAPFVDNNNDGIYNPYDGDYPKIKGDQMCYSIFNDVLKLHTETGGKPMGLEFHKSSYAAVCPQVADSDRVINYTTFYEVEIFNRSDTTYHDMYIGLYADMDAGNYLDDYVGCDTMLHAGFTYNGDNDDEDANGESPGYGLNPPIQNVTILDGPLADHNDGLDNDNDGVVDEIGEQVLMSSFIYSDNNASVFGNPTTALNHYYRMAAKWLNGQQLTYGGDGHGGGIGATNIPCRYMFPGTPYDTSQWNETSAGNMPFDRRFLMGSGPFTLPAHDKTKIFFAYVWTRDELNPNGINTSIARNRSDLMKVRQWFAADTIPSCLQLYAAVEENSLLKPLFNLYPNPVDEIINIQYAPKSLKPLYKIYDIAGRVIKSGKLRENISAINMAGFKQGSYVFEISDGDIRTAGRFVKE
jgi:hypothetical protein